MSRDAKRSYRYYREDRILSPGPNGPEDRGRGTRWTRDLRISDNADMPALVLLLLLVTPARAATPALVFNRSENEVLRLTAADLTARPSARDIEIDDPFYGRTKRYRAVPLKDLLTAAYGASWMENGLGEVFFDALDGYRSHARISVLLAEGGMVAFADLDAPGWEEIPKKAMKPAPFYLVWTGSEQGPKKGFPWPWQLTTVEMAVLEDEYPKALPRGSDPDSAAVRGWKLFRASCISCHSMSGDGGTVGPDLNFPRGITRYQSRGFLKKYIRKPSSFRRTKMPDFDELESGEIRDILAYFDYMTRLAQTK